MPATDPADAPGLADDLVLLAEAARAAGDIAMRYFRRDQQVWLKGGTSPVSEADYAADRFLRETLTAARPDYGWLSEESAGARRIETRRTFVIDPIDGTRGFLDGLNEWCIAAAVVEHDRPIAGVLECPAKNETFRATLGGGAWKNDRRIAVAAERPQNIVGGPSAMIRALPPEIRDRVRHTKYVPSLAYRIAMVADGTMDATFVKPNSQDWDLAAADLILHEAGGGILDARGRTPRYAGGGIPHGSLVCGSGALLEAMAASIRGSG